MTKSVSETPPKGEVDEEEQWQQVEVGVEARAPRPGSPAGGSRSEHPEPGSPVHRAR